MIQVVIRPFSLLIIALVASQFGCGANRVELKIPALEQAISDLGYCSGCGPQHAAIVISASAPAFQPSVISAISMDFSIRHGSGIDPTPISPWAIPEGNLSTRKGDR
jgi:hypothetical protein